VPWFLFRLSDLQLRQAESARPACDAPHLRPMWLAYRVL